jgi:hypothetical protein
VFLLFLRRLRFAIRHRKNAGLALMLGALLIENGCRLFVAYAASTIAPTAVANTDALPFFSASIAAMMLSAGMFLMRHRIRELQELRVMRRELQMVFGT